jgi:hypothetical protein
MLRRSFFFLQKNFCTVFRIDAQLHQLTRALLPRTIHSTKSISNKQGTGRAQLACLRKGNPRHLKNVLKVSRIVLNRPCAVEGVRVTVGETKAN